MNTINKQLITDSELTGKLLGLTSFASPVPKIDSSGPSSPSVSLPHPSERENFVPYSIAALLVCPLEPEKYRKRKQRDTTMAQKSTMGRLLCAPSFLPLISEYPKSW
jgi:hypothetical protein